MTSHVSSFAGNLNGKTISCERSAAEIGQEVRDGTIVVIKQVFSEKDARRLRDLTFAWGQVQESTRQADFYSLTKNNHFCLEQGVSNRQKTLHYYHSHNFNDPHHLEPIELRELLARFCDPLADFYNRITGHKAGLEGECALHPQIIHYPSGGGFFARHTHPIEPQRIGIIVSLAKHGEDFRQGGTGFEIDGEILSIEPHHDLGDVALFRFDLPHWVSPIDIGSAMDRSSSQGRWTLVLPYY